MQTTRREYLTAVGTATVASLAPTTTPGLTGWSAPDDAVLHSGDRPSWIVSVDEDDGLSALEDWVESGDDRDLIDDRTHEDSGTATVIAPAADIGARSRDQLLGFGLQGRSYIESIELNRTVSFADPVDTEGVDEFDGLSWIERRVHGFSDSGLDMVAFDGDMEETTLQESRKAMDATDPALDDRPDTSDVTVAVVDTGIDDGSVFDDDGGETRILEESKNFITDATGVGAIGDGNGHGTWVASAIAASSSDAAYDGFCPDASILGCKALDNDGEGSISDIAAAIRYSGDEGADVICLSLGSPLWSRSIEDALAYAVDEGSIPVAAAGNDRQGTRWISTPASSDNAIGVGATTVEDSSEAKSAYFSNVGPHNGLTDDSGGETIDAMPDVAAPGTESTVDTPNGLSTLTGTSMAAPKVAGVIGLYVAHSGGATLEHVRERLRDTSKPVPKAAEEEVGYGMPSAVNMIDGESPDAPQDLAMTKEASSRGSAYRRLSGGRLRTIAHLF